LERVELGGEEHKKYQFKEINVNGAGPERLFIGF